MIVTDYNLMSVEELLIINERTGVEFQINDGKIVSIEIGAKRNGQDSKSNSKENSPAAGKQTGLIKLLHRDYTTGKERIQ